MNQNTINDSFLLSLEKILPNFFDDFQIKSITDHSFRVTDSHGIEIILSLNYPYPAVSPTILVSVDDEIELIQTEWDLEIYDVNERIEKMLKQFLLPPRPYKKVFGKNGLVLSKDSKTAKFAGWNRYYTGISPEDDLTYIKERLFARTKGLLSDELQNNTILIVGAGSVGSYMTEQFVRSGVESFILIDPDIVEIANLSRTNYSLNDVGDYKVEALARNMMNINPCLSITTYKKNIGDFSSEEFSSIFDFADLVIATTDDPSAQLQINRFAFCKGKPCLFVGLYKGAKGGEVIISIPEKTPCYRCAAPVREHFGINHLPETDYGTNRLKGEIALSSDIQHVSSAAVKIGLSILSAAVLEQGIGQFINKLLVKGFYYLTMSMEEDYWYFPHIFKETPGQAAFQSVWLTPETDSECPICGDHENRIRPEQIPMTTPDTSSL
ncbi:ThiF family adenylyltransferase [Neobacillus sp. 3P2-tot-E-2]|uniref:ThiF family adenylyltransferase n=1 Tax=Neobacillus sp. 3P2-tot-E-2 TaxID=3132212 RepID=UPI0039A2593B